MCDPEAFRTGVVLLEAFTVIVVVGVLLFSGAARLWVKTARKTQPLLRTLQPALMAFAAVAVLTYVFWGFACGG